MIKHNEDSPVKDNTVTISKAYFDQLVRDQEFLEALQGAGVDNWSGYGYACEIFHENRGDEE